MSAIMWLGYNKKKKVAEFHYYFEKLFKRENTIQCTYPHITVLVSSETTADLVAAYLLFIRPCSEEKCFH